MSFPLAFVPRHLYNCLVHQLMKRHKAPSEDVILSFLSFLKPVSCRVDSMEVIAAISLLRYLLDTGSEEEKKEMRKRLLDHGALFVLQVLVHSQISKNMARLGGLMEPVIDIIRCFEEETVENVGKKEWMRITRTLEYGLNCHRLWEKTMYREWLSQQKMEEPYGPIRRKCATEGCTKESTNLGICSRCRTVSYCCDKCQIKDWSRHRETCIHNTPKEYHVYPTSVPPTLSLQTEFLSGIFKRIVDDKDAASVLSEDDILRCRAISRAALYTTFQPPDQRIEWALNGGIDLIELLFTIVDVYDCRDTLVLRFLSECICRLCAFETSRSVVYDRLRPYVEKILLSCPDLDIQRWARKACRRMSISRMWRSFKTSRTPSDAGAKRDWLAWEEDKLDPAVRIIPRGKRSK
jgi:hypothetical protein